MAREEAKSEKESACLLMISRNGDRLAAEGKGLNARALFAAKRRKDKCGKSLIHRIGTNVAHVALFVANNGLTEMLSDGRRQDSLDLA